MRKCSFISLIHLTFGTCTFQGKFITHITTLRCYWRHCTHLGCPFLVWIHVVAKAENWNVYQMRCGCHVIIPTYSRRRFCVSRTNFNLFCFENEYFYTLKCYAFRPRNSTLWLLKSATCPWCWVGVREWMLMDRRLTSEQSERSRQIVNATLSSVSQPLSGFASLEDL